MRRWVAALLGVTVVGLLLQVALILRDGPPSWLLHLQHDARGPPPQNATTPSTLRPLTLPYSLRQGEEARSDVVGDRHAHHPYRFVLNEPAACRRRTELVMVVITAPNNTEDRQAVRDTWGGSSHRGNLAQRLAMVFLVGATSDRTVQAKLARESRRHRDMLQEDFVDSYRNLSLKSVAMLKWVTTFCNSSQFVLKADDDMYINVTNLLAALRKESLSHSTFVLGHVFTGSRPVQNKKSKWYTPTEQFSEEVYPRYTSGTAYAMTTSAARELYAASAHVPLFWLEDVYVTGLCSRKAGVPVYNHGGFSYVKSKVDGCHFRRVISGHRYSAQEKRDIFKQVNDPNLKC